jgi:DNA polymerase-4
MGLHTGADLKRLSEPELVRHFGKSGKFFFKIVRGVDEREVQPHRETKSIGAEDTFPFDLTTPDDLQDALMKITRTVYDRLLRSGLKGRTITLKIKYHDFKQVTRSHSSATGIEDKEMIFRTAIDLLLATGIEKKKIRLLGISLSNFSESLPRQNQEDAVDQLKLF